MCLPLLIVRLHTTVSFSAFACAHHTLTSSVFLSVSLSPLAKAQHGRESVLPLCWLLSLLFLLSLRLRCSSLTCLLPRHPDPKQLINSALKICPPFPQPPCPDKNIIACTSTQCSICLCQSSFSSHIPLHILIERHRERLVVGHFWRFVIFRLIQ